MFFPLDLFQPLPVVGLLAIQFLQLRGELDPDVREPLAVDELRVKQIGAMRASAKLVVDFLQLALILADDAVVVGADLSPPALDGVEAALFPKGREP